MSFETFLPDALADGRYVAAPAVEIVGHGLVALERQRRGVSGDEAGGDVVNGFVVSVTRFRVRSLRFLPWRNEAALLAYVTGGAHRTAMPR